MTEAPPLWPFTQLFPIRPRLFSSIQLSTPEVSHLCRVQGEDHFLHFIGSAFHRAAWYAISFLYHKVCSHIFLIQYDPLVLLCKAAWQVFKSQPMTVFLPRYRTCHSSYWASRGIYQTVSSVCWSLSGSTMVWSFSYSSEFHIICEPAEIALCPVICIIKLW